jgi:hypothetical protein
MASGGPLGTPHSLAMSPGRWPPPVSVLGINETLRHSKPIWAHDLATGRRVMACDRRLTGFVDAAGLGAARLFRTFH